MTDSWTEDANEVLPGDAEAARSISPSGVAPPTEYDDDQVPPRPEEIPKLQLHPQHSPEHEQALAQRELIRDTELKHLEELRSLTQRAIDAAEIDPVTGVKLLLNISKVRIALAGVAYLGAF